MALLRPSRSLNALNLKPGPTGGLRRDWGQNPILHAPMRSPLDDTCSRGENPDAVVTRRTAG